jgi:excisionase family DNA binding protein
MTASRRDIIEPYAPRGMSAEEASRYLGIGRTKFEEMVRDGRMPKAKKIDGRRVWDRFALDVYFADLPDEDSGNFYDRAKAAAVARVGGGPKPV